MKTNEKKQPLLAEIYDYVEIIVVAISIVLMIFTVGVRLSKVDGRSMETTLEDGQLLLTSNAFYKPKDGDIVIFHQSDNQNNELNKQLVKRVIATENEWYKLVYVKEGSMLFTMKVYVGDSDSFDEDDRVDETYIDDVVYANSPSYALFRNATVDENGNYVVTGKVPAGHVFVMGDNRYNSNDSRLDVGYVDVRNILGKALFSINPLGGIY